MTTLWLVMAMNSQQNAYDGGGRGHLKEGPCIRVGWGGVVPFAAQGLYPLQCNLHLLPEVGVASGKSGWSKECRFCIHCPIAQ